MKVESALTPKPDNLSPEPNRNNILYQVIEVHYPVPNCYEAADNLLQQINELIADPNTTENDRWLFTKKGNFDPSAWFMMYHDSNEIRGLVYDFSFMLRALSISETAVLIRIGKTAETIFNRYYREKFRDSSEAPKFPETVVQGVFGQNSAGTFSFDSIYYNGLGCRRQYELSHKIPGFPTTTYNELMRLRHCSDEDKKKVILQLLTTCNSTQSLEEILQILRS